MPGFCTCKRYTRFLIYLNILNNAWIDYSDYGRVFNITDQNFTGL